MIQIASLMETDYQYFYLYGTDLSSTLFESANYVLFILLYSVFTLVERNCFTAQSQHNFCSREFSPSVGLAGLLSTSAYFAMIDRPDTQSWARATTKG